MRSRSEKPADAGAGVDAVLIEKWALSYLERYASSAENLRRVLQRRAWRRLGNDGEAVRVADAAIDQVVERCRSRALVDDALYAAARARSGQARGRSLRRIAAGLAAKGVSPEDATAALAGLREDSADPDLAGACAFARRRRFGPFRQGEPDQAGRQRELASFARAGFSRRVAESVLACADPAAVEALLEGEGRLGR